MDSVASFKVVLVVSQHHYFGETKFSEFGGTFPNFNSYPQLGPPGFAVNPTYSGYPKWVYYSELLKISLIIDGFVNSK